MFARGACLRLEGFFMTAIRFADLHPPNTVTVNAQDVLMPGDLRPGDVLLHEPGRQRWYEKGIAVATGSRFTHASIYIGDNTIAEARRPRVRVCDIARPIRRERQLCILRQPKTLRREQVAALRSFVHAALQREARFDDAFPFVFYTSRLARRLLPATQQPMTHRPLPPANRAKYFCTSFVIDAFRAMGLIDQAEARPYRLGSHSAADLLADDKFGHVVGFLQTEAMAVGVSP